jgi:glycosyltransferase involved in cell wall biosynthesis
MGCDRSIGGMREEILLSVLVKAYNEEARIAKCLAAIFAAVDLANTEVILVDSLSEDRTVETARRFPVEIVQFAYTRDRGCGAAAQLGYQFARGRYLLLLDGDMILDPGFLPAAMMRLEAAPRLAGIGGVIRELSTTLEYQQRQLRKDPSHGIGAVSHLDGGGLFRMQALRSVGYLADRNLHSFEEFELGLRLRQQGWGLERIDVPYVDHLGHQRPPYALLLMRWRSRYLRGYGELLRVSWGTPRMLAAVRKAQIFLAVLLWWAGLLAATTCAVMGSNAAALGLAGLFALPLLLLIVRKRSAPTALYTLALWNLYAAALVTGLLARATDPRAPITGVILTGEKSSISGLQSIK